MPISSQLPLLRFLLHTDFERGVGPFREELEEIYLISRGTLTMRCAEDVMHISAPTAVRVDPNTPRSYRNEGDDPVEMWVVSRLLRYSDSTKVPGFWSASSMPRLDATADRVESGSFAGSAERAANVSEAG